MLCLPACHCLLPGPSGAWLRALALPSTGATPHPHPTTPASRGGDKSKWEPFLSAKGISGEDHLCARVTHHWAARASQTQATALTWGAGSSVRRMSRVPGPSQARHPHLCSGPPAPRLCPRSPARPRGSAGTPRCSSRRRPPPSSAGTGASPGRAPSASRPGCLSLASKPKASKSNTVRTPRRHCGTSAKRLPSGTWQSALASLVSALTRKPRLTPSCVSGTQVLRSLLPRGVDRDTERPHPANRRAGSPTSLSQGLKVTPTSAAGGSVPEGLRHKQGPKPHESQWACPVLGCRGHPDTPSTFQERTATTLPPARGLSICTRPAAGKCSAVGLQALSEAEGADAHGGAASSTCPAPTLGVPCLLGHRTLPAYMWLSKVGLDLMLL